MRKRCIADAIYCLDGCVGCRIIPYGVVCSGNVVVDRSWYTDRRHTIFFVKLIEARKGAITTDGDKRIDSLFLYVLKGLCPAFRCSEFLAACRFENCTATLN